MIKITTLRFNGYNYKNFAKYIAENGNYICVVNDEIVNPSDGNKLFRDLKMEYPNHSIEITTLDYNDDEIIKYLDSGIDKYVEYIDNYRQYRDAKENNNRLEKLISKFKSIC